MLEAKVKDSYRAGPIVAFSGHEYVRSEWRAVPAGYEAAALVHPFLDTREAGGKEIKVTSKDYLAEVMSEKTGQTGEPMQPVEGDTLTVEGGPVTTETVEEEKPKKPSRRSKKED